MASSADVALLAGVSRSTVSQVLNGHGDRFVPATVARVRAAAEELGYQPSMAGRTLVRGTSDIVITLVPDMSFSPFFRSLVDLLTRDLAAAGLTNLLRLASSGDTFEDAVLSLRPCAVVAMAPLSDGVRRQLQSHGVHVVEPTRRMVGRTDEAIGRLQAQHLVAAGYPKLAIAVPDILAERAHSLPRARGVQEWCRSEGVALLPTITVRMQPGGATAVVRELPTDVGVAAYNDDVALALLGAALHSGRQVPAELGLIGVDDSVHARLSTPSLTTVAFDLTGSEKHLLRAILDRNTPHALEEPDVDQWQDLSIVAGGSTDRDLRQRSSPLRGQDAAVGFGTRAQSPPG